MAEASQRSGTATSVGDYFIWTAGVLMRPARPAPITATSVSSMLEETRFARSSFVVRGHAERFCVSSDDSFSEALSR